MDQPATEVVVPKAFPQRLPSDLAGVTEGRLLGIRVEMVGGKPKYVLTYEAA